MYDKNHNFYNDLDNEGSGMSNFAIFDEKQWDYIQHRYGLTPRERQVMEDVCKGLRNDDIATDINIALGTVKTHIRNVHRKTQTRSKIGLLLRFIRDIDLFFAKPKPTPPSPIVEIQKSSNTPSTEMGKNKLKDKFI